MSAIIDAQSAMLQMPDSYETAVRLSYIMEIQRNIESIDFSSLVIEKLLSSDAIPNNRILSDTVPPSPTEHYHAAVKRIACNIVQFNFYVPNINRAISNVVQFCETFASVQPVGGPVDRVYMLSALGNLGERSLQIATHTVDARTSRASETYDLDDAVGGICRLVLNQAMDFAYEYRSGSSSIHVALAEVSKILAISNMRGGASFALFSPEAAARFFNVKPNNIIDYIGTSCGRIKCYVTSIMENDDILVGYRGEHSIDSGIVYAPYVMFNSMEPNSGILHRGGFAANANVNDYYRKLILS